MVNFDLIPLSEGQEGDFAILLTDNALSPYFSCGQTVYLLRSTLLVNGDIGLFYTADGMSFRQFCQDSEGNIYLFTTDRSARRQDLRIPAGSEKPVCYGKLLLKRPIPLPID